MTHEHYLKFKVQCPQHSLLGLELYSWLHTDSVATFMQQWQYEEVATKIFKLRKAKIHPIWLFTGKHWWLSVLKHLAMQGGLFSLPLLRGDTGSRVAKSGLALGPDGVA